MSDKDDLIVELRAKLEEQDEFLKAISAEALEFGTIVGEAPGGYHVLATSKGDVKRINKFKGAEIGNGVVVLGSTNQVIETLPPDFELGTDLTTIQRLVEGRPEIEVGGIGHLLYTLPALKEKIKPGDQVLLDHTRQMVLRIVAHPEPELPHYQKVKWCEIAGCSDAKLELKDMIEVVRGNDEIFKAYGMKAPKGFLLYGPPGNGKTMLGRAVATELKSGFIYVKATEILNKYVGTSEERVRGLFSQGKDYRKKTGTPTIIFLDEADAILGRRGSDRTGASLSNTIVPAFLTEMDGFTESGCIVILATNRPDTLDDAVIRDGRIDRKIFIGYPNQEDQQEILKFGLQTTKLKDTLEDCVLAGFEAIGDRKPNGAALVNVTHVARQNAARRDREFGKARGILAQDVREAVLSGARSESFEDGGAGKEAFGDFFNQPEAT